MTGRQDFILTADASQVERVSKQLEAILSRIIQQTERVAASTQKLGAATGGLKRIQKEALGCVNEFLHMASAAEVSAARIKTAFASVKMPTAAVATAATPAPMVMRMQSRHDAARSRSLENVPLFGGHSGLEQGQQVQNAMMGLLPIAAMTAVWGKGVSGAIEQRKSDAVLERIMKNAGIEGKAGGAPPETQQLMGKLIAGGETDINRARQQAGLGMDIEAGGGPSAAAFVEALAQDGPAAAKAMAELAQKAGVQVDQTDTLNAMLEKLTDKFGGMNSAVEDAAGSWPKFFNQVNENLAMFGDMLAKSSSIDGVTAALQGDPDKANFIFGQGLRDSSIGRFISPAMDQMDKLVGGPGNAQEAATKAQERINKALQAGDITKAVWDRNRQMINDSFQDRNYSQLYDLANGKLPGAAVSAGTKGGATTGNGATDGYVDKDGDGHVDTASRRVRGPRTGSQNISITLRSDPNSPTQMSARGL